MLDIRPLVFELQFVESECFEINQMFQAVN